MHDRRKHVRISVSVDLDFKSGHNFFAGRSRDLSIGGLFIETDVALPPGAEIVVAMRLLDKGFAIRSEVAWVRRNEHGDTEGIGVRFLDLHAATRKTIETFMALRHPMPLETAAESSSPRA
jgi:uncharacterized protein (TIGR02266 family)